MEIRPVENPAQVNEARAIFREYEAWLDEDLCFQNFEDEVRNLPGRYSPPEGRLFLLYADDEPVGCVAMRKLGDGICEMKRLYVREGFRGQRLGVRLVERIIDEARAAGYEKMRLDTYPAKMGSAVKLYESHGFREIEAYYDAPKKVLFMELDLKMAFR